MTLRASNDAGADQIASEQAPIRISGDIFRQLSALLGFSQITQRLRFWFASFAYVLICALRCLGLAHTQFADATCGTIRLKLFKIGALVQVSVRRIRFALASACPYANEWRIAAARLARGSPA